MDEAFAIHPDGTPVNPEKFRDALRQGEYQGEAVPSSWMSDQHLAELVAGDDLEAFTDYLQQMNYDRMFDSDGAALDIKEWRQSVRDDHHYAQLLQDGYPEVYELIASGSDEEVQNMLRAQRRAQLEAAAQQKSEL